MTRSPLVGRDSEMAVLATCLEAARHSQPAVVLCRGQPGIGKTRLAQELVASAIARGFDCAWGRAVDSEGAPPYWAWRQVLSAIGEAVDLHAIAEQHSLTIDLARLAPDVFARRGDAGDRTGSAEDRFRQFDAVARLLRYLSLPQPWVIVFDDVHWADHPSLLLLQHVTRFVRDEQLVMFVAYRDTEDGHGRVIAELAREPVVTQIELRGLSPAAVARQLSSVVGRQPDDAEVARVCALTGGNPFFVGEMGRLLADRGDGASEFPVTGAVRDAIGARLHRLHPDCVALLQSAAVVGREFPVAVVAAMTRQPGRRCLGFLDEAAAAGLTEPMSGPGQHRFSHALVRDAIEAGVGTPERVRLHRLAAEAIESCYANRLDVHLSDLARHWTVAAAEGNQVTAVRWIQRAADEAMSRLAYEEGARLFRLAHEVGAGVLDEVHSCRLLLALGNALHLSADLVGRLAVCREAARLARRLGRPDLLAEAALTLERVGYTESDLAARALCEEAIAALGAEHPALRARVTARFAETCMYLEDHETARAASDQALSMAERCGDRVAIIAALRARRFVRSVPEGLDERIRLAERILAIGRDTADPHAQLLGHLWRIDASFQRGDLAAVAGEIPSVASYAQRVRGPLARWELLRCEATLAQAQARFDDARRLAAQAFDALTATRHPSAPPVRFGLMAIVGHHVGHDTEWLAAHGLADGPAGARDLPTAGVIRALAPALVLAEVGRLDQAAAVYHSLGPVADWRPTPHASLFAYTFGVTLAAALGASADVVTLRQLLSPYRGHHVASGAGCVAYFGPVELWLGIAAAHLGLFDNAVADLERAVKASAAARADGFHAEAQYDLANVLARRARPGDLPRARGLAADASTQAETLRMVPIARKARDLMHRLDAASPSALTPREQQVANLVAQGLTNRRIAHRLVISERTAQNHVQHILTKLGFTTRSQIAAWSARANN